MKYTLAIGVMIIGLMGGCESSVEKNSNPSPAPAEQPFLVAGPMLGYVEHREAMIWLEVALIENYSNEVRIHYYPKDEPALGHSVSLANMGEPLKFVLPYLDINTEYEYEVYINKEKQSFPYPTRFKTRTLWEYRTDAPDVAFLFGSCNYINDSLYDRPGEPYGKGTQIFEVMTKQPADFMLWLGDNTYLRPADYSSASGMAYRYRHTRSLPEMQPLLAAMSHYAIWDDHDYGPNDGDKTYELKEESRKLFMQYWGNKTYGTEDNLGIYSKFAIADAEFYLLDDRYHRSPNSYPKTHTDKEFLGKKQLQWLKESLLASNPQVNFRFIAVGNQVLNPVNNFECYRQFENEWQELIDFIVQHRIPGVVFLSGDRHMTEINFFQPGKEFYTLYDVTSSPLTSRAFSTIADHPEYNNPARVDSTLLTEQNFVKATITGSFLANDRTLTFTAIDATGKVRWTKSFHENELKVPNGE